MAKSHTNRTPTLIDLYTEYLDQTARFVRDKSDQRLLRILSLSQQAAEIRSQNATDLAIKFVMGGAAETDNHPLQTSLRRDMNWVLASLYPAKPEDAA